MRSRSALGILTAPFLLAAALAGCGPVSAASGGSAAAATRPSTSAAAAKEPAGGPVPSGFTGASATWVSADEGFVLGTAPCAKAPCTSIVRTTDRGATWKGLPAPVVPLGRLGSANPQVWGIRFATPTHGFVFGTELQETTDGGEHWHPARLPEISDPSIVSAEISGGQLLALMEQCVPNQGCDTAHAWLMRRPLSGGAWQSVAQTDGAAPIATGSGVAAVLNGSRVLTTTDGGRSVQTHATPCTDPDTNGAAAVAVTGPDSLALLCAGSPGAGSAPKTVYVSYDRGGSWTKEGSPSSGGDPVGIAGGTPARLVVAAASGASALYDSTDAGQKWGTAYEKGDGGLSFNDLGFTNSSDGSVVYGPATTDDNSTHAPGRLLLTGNGGTAWSAVTW